jgi:hypothetical protein
MSTLVHIPDNELALHKVHCIAPDCQIPAARRLTSQDPVAPHCQHESCHGTLDLEPVSWRKCVRLPSSNPTSPHRRLQTASSPASCSCRKPRWKIPKRGMHSFRLEGLLQPLLKARMRIYPATIAKTSCRTGSPRRGEMDRVGRGRGKLATHAHTPPCHDQFERASIASARPSGVRTQRCAVGNQKRSAPGFSVHGPPFLGAGVG